MSALRAAAGAVDLRPIIGARLTGYALRLEPSSGIHDPLMAKLLLLDDGDTRLLWIACDLIGFDPADDAELRRLVSSRLSIPPENVIVSCTHTHSGPSSMPFRGTLAQVDRTWLHQTFDAIANEAGELRPRPALLTHATTAVPDIGFNRQDKSSPIDERLLVARLSDQDDKTIATIINYATHPVVLAEKNLLYSADFAGYATDCIGDEIGSIALFIQGSAGDVNPFIFRDHPRDAGTFDVAERMGRTLARSAIDALERATDFSAPHQASIAIAQRIVELPLAAAPTVEQCAQLRSELESRDPRWAMFERIWLEELEQAIARNAVPRSLSVTLSACRIGRLYIVTFPLEIYSQIGLDIRDRLAPRHLIIAGYTNGLYGYAPTDLAIEQGGYGPAMAYRFFPRLLTPLDRGCASILTRTATDLVKSLA
jgi:neutral ceramidase